jgi:hypothetical protein
MEAEVGTEMLGDRQTDRGRQARYASSHSCWQVGRMKVVAGSGRAKGGGRQGKVEKQTQVGRSDKQKDAIWQEEACCHLETGRQAEGGREEIEAGRQWQFGRGRQVQLHRSVGRSAGRE